MSQKTVEDLIHAGVTVDVCRCDIANQQSVEQNLAPLLSRSLPVRGVIYGAMVLRVLFFTSS